MKSAFFKLLGLVFSFALGNFVGIVAASPDYGVIVGLLFVGLNMLSKLSVRPTGALYSSLDITELAESLGDYHREHRDELSAEVLLDEDFTTDMEVMDDVTDEVPLPGLEVGEMLQPGADPTFKPKENALKFKARILKVRDCKVDLLLVPKLLEKTWLGKMKKPSDPFDMPFEKFIIDYIHGKIKEELRLLAIYKGVYNVEGTGPKDTMQGYLKFVADAITGGEIAPVATGVITASNVVDKLESVYDALSEAQKGKPTIMKVSPTLYDWYSRKYRSDFGSNQDYKAMQVLRRPLDGTLCDLVREPGLAGSQRVLCTPVENFVYGVDSASGYNMDIQKFDRQLKILIDLKAGVNFKQVSNRSLAVNDQQ